MLSAFYSALGVEPPAPGIERLAFLTVEAAHDPLRKEWEEGAGHIVKALELIAARPTVERNPDGEDQAAATMQLIARQALERYQGRDSNV